jgi:hypothetical protein
MVMLAVVIMLKSPGATHGAFARCHTGTARRLVRLAERAAYLTVTARSIRRAAVAVHFSAWGMTVGMRCGRVPGVMRRLLALFRGTGMRIRMRTLAAGTRLRIRMGALAAGVRA